MRKVYNLLIITLILLVSACINRTPQDTLYNPQSGQTYQSYDEKWYQNPNTGETLHKFDDNFYQNPNTGEIYYGY